MMFNRLWFDIAIFLVRTIVIYVEIPMLPLLGIEESRRFIFLNLRESGAVGKGGGSLLRTWETQSVGRRACGGAASPAFQICDM